MAYEWMWSGESAGGFFACGVVGLTAFLGLFIKVITQENRTGKRRDLSPMMWFLLAALTCALFYSVLERTAQGVLTHVPILPMYFILFVDFFASGCYTWWKKHRRNS